MTHSVRAFAVSTKGGMDFSEFAKDPTKNLQLGSPVPRACKDQECLLGIDEAGRGPVLGPMVYAAAYCPLSHASKLKEMGFADSKTLTEEKRESLLDSIVNAGDMIGWLLEVLSPTVISNNMLRRSKYNLNALSHDSAIALIRRALDLGLNIAEVYVDTVGVAAKYQAKLSEIFPNIKITVANKADATFPVVSAASICAKVGRDHALKDWRFTEDERFCGKEYGSGYPNDPTTKKFLVENIDAVFGFPQLVRFSWSTASKILDEKSTGVTWSEVELDEEEQADEKKQQLLTFFTKNSSHRDMKTKTHNFFSQRNLFQTVNI